MDLKSGDDGILGFFRWVDISHGRWDHGIFMAISERIYNGIYIGYDGISWDIQKLLGVAVGDTFSGCDNVEFTP